MTLADKIVVLRDGRIEQVGSPIDLYERPQNPFVAQFIGSPKLNFFDTVELAPAATEFMGRSVGDSQIVGIRPEFMTKSFVNRPLGRP